MYADYVVWVGVPLPDWPVDDFFNGGVGIPMERGNLGDRTVQCNVWEECDTAVWM